MDLQKWEIELKKRTHFPYEWGTKQNNFLDRLTKFVLHTYSFEALQEMIEKKFAMTSNYVNCKNYAMNRWYNFWSAKAIEQIFASHRRVQKEKNEYHKTIDFFIDGIPFDHKTTVYPKSFQESIFDLKKELFITWLYDNQSREQRFHFENRLFLLLYDSNGKHWKLKAELSWITFLIYEYLNHFEAKKLYYLTNNKGKKIAADIIWGYRLF